MLRQLRKDLRASASAEKAKVLARFFKTGKGEYGEGDVFLGVMVPETRKVAKKYAGLPLNSINELLKSEIHEERLASLLILVEKYKESQDKVMRFYLRNAKHVNNWDLVDLSAPNILGAYLLENKKERKILDTLAKSGNLWERRIAIVATYALIRNQEYEETFNIAETLLKDRHDLIHKAVGWMLREVGKRDEKAEEAFLKKHYKVMPKTMLRYAIERFSEKKRKEYLINSTKAY